jgi:2-haloacid dehalogenase
MKIDPSMRNELLDLYKILSPFKEVPEVLKSLKERDLKLAILSNGTPALLNQLVKSNNLDNLFDDLFSIEEVGIYKPDSKVYEMPIKKYNIQKNEVAFLSANTWDVSGGGNYGFNSIWVNRNNNIFDNLDYKPNLEIQKLTRSVTQHKVLVRLSLISIICHMLWNSFIFSIHKMIFHVFSISTCRYFQSNRLRNFSN